MEKAAIAKALIQNGDTSQMPPANTPDHGNKPKVAEIQWLTGKECDEIYGPSLAKNRANHRLNSASGGSAGPDHAANPLPRRSNSAGEDEHNAAPEHSSSSRDAGGYKDSLIECRSTEKPVTLHVEEKKMAPSSNNHISDKTTNHKPVIGDFDTSHSLRSNNSNSAIAIATKPTHSAHSNVRERIIDLAKSPTNSPQTSPPASMGASDKVCKVQTKREKTANGTNIHTRNDDYLQSHAHAHAHAHITNAKRQAVQNTSLLNNTNNKHGNLTNTTHYRVKTNKNKLSDNAGVQQQQQKEKIQQPLLLVPTTPIKSTSKNNIEYEQTVQLQKLDAGEKIAKWLAQVPTPQPGEDAIRPPPLTPATNKTVQRTRDNVAAEPTATTTMGSKQLQQQQQLHSSPLKRRRRQCIDSDDFDDDEDVIAVGEEAHQLPTEVFDAVASKPVPVMETPAYVSKFTKELQEIIRTNLLKVKQLKHSDTNKSPNCNAGANSQQLPEHLQQQQQQQTLQLLQQKQSMSEINIGKRIPILFLPKVPDDDIVLFTNKLLSIPAIGKGKFKTRLTASNGIRVISADMETYQAIHSTLANESIPLHTHQPKKNRGLRVILRKLHHSTPCSTIKNDLKAFGFNIRFIRMMKHRFTGRPLNLFELEVEPTSNGAHLGILEMESLGNQAIAVERMAKPHDPVQCYRCQAFGHTRNYCHRPYRCMKCAGDHESKSCKKPRGEKPKCANCNERHVSSYKGCVKYKKARDEMRANKVIGGVIYKQHPRQQFYKHQLHQQRIDQRNQRYLQQQQSQMQKSRQYNSQPNMETNTAGNARMTKSLTAPYQHPQQQHQQQPQNAVSRNNPRWQTRSAPGQKEQQQLRNQQQSTSQPANKIHTNVNTYHDNKQAPHRNAIAIGPAGKHLEKLQNKLKLQQQQQQQQSEVQQQLHNKPSILPIASAATTSTANLPTPTPARKQKPHPLANLEAKLDKMLEALENLINIRAGTNTLKPCVSTSPRSDSKEPAMETDACYYA